jgi:hypothetical protein
MWRLKFTNQLRGRCFAGNDTGWVRLIHRSKFVSNLVGVHSGAIRCGMAVELICAKNNSQVMNADSGSTNSSSSNKPNRRSAALKTAAGGETRSKCSRSTKTI